MEHSFPDLHSFLNEQKVGVVPWSAHSDQTKRGEVVVSQRDRNSGNGRLFHFLRAIEGLDAYADDFGFQWTHLYDDYRKDRYKHLEQFLRLGINPNSLASKNCLDVGCGLGRLSEICLGKANYVFGVDLSAAVIVAARVIRSDRFIPLQASADDLPLKSESFDFVYCWGVLHHTQDPQKTLSELWRVLKPGGTLAIWVYARNQWYLKRSLLAKYFSHLDEQEMLALSNTLTSLAHTSQLTAPAYLQMLCSDLCFSVKNTKEYTRHILYDGLGPTFHYLLNSEWFKACSGQLSGLQSLDVVDTPFTVARLKK